MGVGPTSLRLCESRALRDARVPWWRAEVPTGVVIGGRLLFFTVLFAVAMFRGRSWVSETAGICLASLASGAAVATALLHGANRRVSNDLLLLLLAPWFVGALSRGAFEGTVRGAWPLAGGVAVFAVAAVHLRLETAWTRWASLLVGFAWAAVP